MTLPTFAAEHRAVALLPAVDDRYLLPKGTQQQTCHMQLLLLIDGTDR